MPRGGAVVVLINSSVPATIVVCHTLVLICRMVQHYSLREGWVLSGDRYWSASVAGYTTLLA
eukprot:3941737-Rhodomonas_salina.9